MELRALLRILLRKWWLVLVTFGTTLVATIVFTLTAPWVFQATATYVVAPNASFETVGSFVNGLDVLSRRTEIAGTFAEVANSHLVKDMASDELRLSPEQKRSLAVSSIVRAGTNVLEITVEGTDQVLVRDFANMIGTQAETYTRGLYETYELRSLDQARLPSSPIRPNRTLYLALGAAAGLALGVGLVLLVHYLQIPSESDPRQA